MPYSNLITVEDVLHISLIYSTKHVICPGLFKFTLQLCVHVAFGYIGCIRQILGNMKVKGICFTWPST